MNEKLRFLRISIYLFSFIAVAGFLTLYKNDVQATGTDDISKIEQSTSGSAIDAGIEFVSEDTESAFYSFEKDYIIKTPSKEEVETLEETEYIVQKGDTLLKIAEKTGQNLNVIIANNPKLANGYLKIGDKIKILSKNGIYYTVKKGDTLRKISNLYKVEVSDIYSANSKEELKSLKIGEKIFIPNPDFEIIERNRKLREKELKLAAERAEKLKKEKRERAQKLAQEKLKRLLLVKNEKNKSIFSWPIEWHGVASGYGMRIHPIYKRWIFHKGIDLNADIGTPVIAAATGKVTYAGWMSGYGNLIIIEHDDNYSTRYGHLDSINVEVGETVKRGQLIAKSGNTGNSTGPHLHYEIRRNNLPLNPINFR